MSKVCIINVAGLTPHLVQHATRISEIAKPQGLRGPLPSVTCTSQATMLTGLSPAQHGIVGNGWYFRDTGEVRFWQQSNRLVQGKKFYEGIRTAKLFWWFNQGAPVQWYVTPKPHYGSDGSKEFDILDGTGCDLTSRIGRFPFFSFWGPQAGLPSSQWIASASSIVLRDQQPDLTLVYLPHLDYDFQRFSEHSPERVAEVDACAGKVIEAAREIEAEVIVVSEYGLVPVSRPIYINQLLRRAGWLTVRDGPFGEMLMPLESQAFAVADHQLAHLYIKGIPLREVRSAVESLEGVDAVVDPGDVGLNHARSGELIALAKPDSWFVYYYWFDDTRAPDFARTVDIHRKPGYDPCELFMTSKTRALGRLVQKRAGFRYRMDIVPLDPGLVRGSHGLRPDPQHGPVIVAPDAPDEMQQLSTYVSSRLTH